MSENFAGPWVLVRIATNYDEDDPTTRYNLHEFVGKSLGEAVEKALDWNAQRIRENPDSEAPIIIEHRIHEEGRWVEVDWETMIRPLD